VRPQLRAVVVPAVVAAVTCAPARAAAQAFTAPQGVGTVTVVSQVVDNTGHRLSDGFLLERGPSVTSSVLVEAEYAFTDRLSVTAGIPYVFARYTGTLPSLSGLAYDECRCWQSSFQDFTASARYRTGSDVWAITPLVRFGVPSHAYPYAGEAVVGRKLREAQVGVSAGLLLVHVLPKASLQTTYTYSFVEKPLEDVDLNRSNAAFDFGYGITRQFFVRGGGLLQRTHGGLRAGSVTGNPFPFPGELAPIGGPRYAQRDRVLRSNYWQVGGGLSYTVGAVDLFASVMKYVSGTDSHNGQVYTFGSSWYFDLRD
jgi:hypothetical protein